MKECSSRDSPMETSQIQKRKVKTNVENTQKVPYKEAIGSLLYLAGATRPDIAFAVNVLSRSQANPTYNDWKDVIRVLRYLTGESTIGLIYRAKSNELEGTTDSSFRDWNDSASTSGYVITLYGDAIAWRSHKQNHKSLSTCQAEYLAASEVCQELISLDKAVRDIIGSTFYSVTVWCDNTSAGKNTEIEGSHKLKDFDYTVSEVKENLRFREETGKKVPLAESNGDYVKSLVIEGKVKVKWVNTKDNIADLMTKPLNWKSHQELTGKILTSDLPKIKLK